MANFEFRKNLPETITTQRLILSAPAREHVVAMARLANNDKIYAALSRLPNPYTQEHAIDFIDNIARTDSEHAYAVSLTDNSFIGTIGIHFVNNVPELGYWLGEPYWGEGYASEAAAALLAALDEIGCELITARALTSNGASIAVLTKSSFLKTKAGVEDCGPHKGVHVTTFRRERIQ